MQSWYAVNTKPHSELRAYEALINRGFETYLPMLPGTRGRKAEPLFPAYLFVCCELETVGIDSLQFVPGLRRIVAFGGKPAVVPDEALDLIRDSLSAIEVHGLPAHSFRPGDAVVIQEGPLAGLRGVFQGPAGAAERVEILVRFLGEANRAEVPVELLRGAEQHQSAAVRQRGTRGKGRHIRYNPAQRPDQESE